MNSQPEAMKVIIDGDVVDREIESITYIDCQPFSDMKIPVSHPVVFEGEMMLHTLSDPHPLIIKTR